MEGREREMEEERRRHGWRVSTRELVRCSKGRGWLHLLYCTCISVCCTLNSSRLTRNLPQCCSVNFRIKSCHARARNDQQGRRAHLSAASVSLSSRQVRLAPAGRVLSLASLAWNLSSTRRSTTAVICETRQAAASSTAASARCQCMACAPRRSLPTEHSSAPHSPPRRRRHPTSEGTGFPDRSWDAQTAGDESRGAEEAWLDRPWRATW